jgi:hypothetical protein
VIPSLGYVLLAHTAHVRLFRLPETPCDAPRLGEALTEAAALAAGHEAEEPAALLFALTRRPRALGHYKVWETFPLFLAERHAERLGVALQLDPGDVALEILRLRVKRGDATFEEVRAWIAARLRPIG